MTNPIILPSTRRTRISDEPIPRRRRPLGPTESTSETAIKSGEAELRERAEAGSNSTGLHIVTGVPLDIGSLSSPPPSRNSSWRAYPPLRVV
jgi:hypothetical protein